MEVCHGGQAHAFDGGHNEGRNPLHVEFGEIAGIFARLEESFECDYSVASVESIDRILRRWTYSRRFDQDVVLSLWAYVGEVIRRQTDGRWRMMTRQPGEPPVTMITTHSGKRGVGVAGFYNELDEFAEEGSLAEVVLIAIDSLGPASGARE